MVHKTIRHSREGGNPEPMRPNKQPCVYILASRRNGTLYTGVTSDLVKRVWEHRSDLVEGFTKRYGVHCLVYFELHSEMAGAILREKQIKKWHRAWKIRLIERTNARWSDLWESIVPEALLDSRLRGNDEAEVGESSGAVRDEHRD
jgi:putative endonuclease